VSKIKRYDHSVYNQSNNTKMKNKIVLSVLLFLFTTVAAFSQFGQSPLSWRFSLEDAGNGEVNIVAVATVEAGWYIYATEIPDGGPTPTTLTIEEVTGARVVGEFRSETAPRMGFDTVFEMELGKHDGTTRFVQRLQVTDRATFAVAGYVRAQACNDEVCTPPLPTDFAFSASDLPATLTVQTATTTAAAAAISAPLPPAMIEENEAVEEVTATALPIPAAIDRDLLWAPVIDEVNAFGTGLDRANASVLGIFLLGLVYGFAALLTPCVWPMIPITVSFFLRRNNKNRKKAFRDAVVFGVSIITIYVLLGVVITAIFGAGALNTIATSAVFNLIFFALLVIFGISFLGAFELTLPASWTTKMDSKADSTSGMVSLFFMALALSLASFSCTGPIVGWLLVDAASSGNYLGPAFGMLGFSIALSIPFVLLAIFPAWLKSMPKSGGWLNSVKVVLGFIVLALSLKFLSTADLTNGWGILNRDVFLVIWIVLATILGFYLLGKIKFSHDSDLPYVSVPRLFLSVLSFAFALYMLPGLWGAPLKPISSFIPPLATQDFRLAESPPLQKFNDFETGMAYAAQVGRPVMLEFGGYGCVNCHKMYATVFADERVRAMLEEEFVIIALMTDSRVRLPEIIEVEEEGGRITRLRTVGDKWSHLQRHKFGTQTQPYYIVLDHAGRPLSPAHGYDESVENFLEFLRTGLRNFNR
jgi:thiol:disulfide interchange protein DsbD